jgi:hypothetical protein
MKVHVRTRLPCPAAAAWAEVQTSRLLLEVIEPLLRFVPAGADALPERWQQGATVTCKGFFLGLLPLGTHAIYFERIDQEGRVIQTRERGGLIRRWDHTIRVQDAGPGRTLYSDEVEIDAGPLTVVVWLYAHWFYRHRQGRWRRVARRLTTAPSPERGA